MAIKPMNRGDLIATKDGRTFTIEALRFVGGNLYKIEGVDRNSSSPMRTTIWASDFGKVIRRAPRVMDYDIRRECELQPDGQTYLPIERRVSDERNYKTILKVKFDRRSVKPMEAAK
jgi:hypothetical protein